MRKWHRWLSLFFGVILLWIAITGFASQIVPIVQRGGFENEAAEGAIRDAAMAANPGFVCPENMMCRPKPPGGGGSIVGLLHHLHSGESFGPVGTVLFSLAGLAMIFFSFSGMWLYVQMWSHRKERGLNPRWLWK